MREDFLHYIWKHKKFTFSNLRSAKGESISLKSTGQHNYNSGPDFFNAKLQIEHQLWAGNVEIHLKSSDWYLHGHENDRNYDNVILHVVWEHDTEVYRKDGSVIPTLELKHYTSTLLLDNYNRLFAKQQKWINCEKDFATVDDFLLHNWLERLYFERLEQKSSAIQDILKTTQNDWEATLFLMLAKNFGLKVNGEAFMSMAKSFDFSILKKLQHNNNELEALFFGQAGLLNETYEDSYFNKLRNTYRFIKQKFQLDSMSIIPLKFFRLRPSNFPTIRLSQLAKLYHEKPNLFSKVIDLRTKAHYYELFQVCASSYWDTHYNFGVVSKNSKKKLTKSFIYLLLINTIIPIKFCYAKSKGKAIGNDLLQLMKSINSENNTIVSKFRSMKPMPKSALVSQALIQLKTTYCDKHNCLQCAVGNSLLKV